MLAADAAKHFGWGELARTTGDLHDIGKMSEAYAIYIATPESDSGGKGPDHSTAGAREAVSIFGPVLGRMIAFAIAGHHAGLPDFEDLDRRLTVKTIEAYDGWQAHVRHLPKPVELARAWPMVKSPHPGFPFAFLTRMLFSCLVDADWIATERFYAKAHRTSVERAGFMSLDVLRDRLRAHMQRVAQSAAASDVNLLRSDVLNHVVAKAAMPPGLFTLTVPTGGGKTLTSLAFALDHAVHHGLRRVVYVIPYTSIIEQTASVFREALGTDADILEHHASFDWAAFERGREAEADSEGPDGIAKLQRAAENWDAPVIVTTAVQFFESLFASRRSSCRKLHNLAGAVIVLDEAQTLPLPLLHPCLAALDELARNYGATVVLCTATQPAIRCQDGFKKAGLDIPAGRELAPEPEALYARLRRVRVEQAGMVNDAALAARFDDAPQMLCVVNSRSHANALFELIRPLEGATCLTTLLVPRHRRAVLAELRQRLAAGLPVRLVATSLVEAGVDISFPEVWRALTGLDSIAQAAGRCNREGGPALGRVVVFEPEANPPPRSLKLYAGVAKGVLARHQDPLSLAALRDFFSQVYWLKGPDAFDAATLDGQCFPILPDLEASGPRFNFHFDSIARAFRMIDEAMAPVIVPWSSGPSDTEAQELIRRIAAMDVPLRADLRALQQYVVPIPRAARRDWLALGALQAVNTGLGDALLAFADTALYDAHNGLRLSDPAYRSAEGNIC